MAEEGLKQWVMECGWSRVLAKILEFEPSLKQLVPLYIQKPFDGDLEEELPAPQVERAPPVPPLVARGGTTR